VLQGLYPASYNVASFSYAVHSRAFAYHPSLLFILENPGFFFFVFVFVCVGGTVYYSQAIVVCIMYLMCYIFFCTPSVFVQVIVVVFFFFFHKKKNPQKRLSLIPLF